ncbi:MAG: LytR/AlgR family response regulator transcription factor [Bacteroidia bacterium]
MATSLKTFPKNKFNVIIIDDEKPAIEILKNLISNFYTDLEVLYSTTNPVEAVEMINNFDFDILLLDIKMPKLNGFELLHKISDRTFHLVFTTAHDKFALHALRANAIDFLLKPIGIRELDQCIKKIRLIGKLNSLKPSGREFNKLQRLNLLNTLKAESKYQSTITINNGFNYHIINTEDIIRVESSEKGIRLYTKNKLSLYSDQTLKDFEHILNPEHFIRSHISHLINKNYIRSFWLKRTGEAHMLDGATIPISARRKKEFLEKINYER